MAPIPVYVELGARRVFAGALDWPGWCRSARDEDSALEALAAYGPRYAAAIGRSQRSFKPPFRVVERLEGNATTDFGAPGIAPGADARKITDAELSKLTKLLEACWAAFDDAATEASGVILMTGPRGGGRDVKKMISHVYGADHAYVSRLGVSFRASKDEASDMQRLRAAFAEALVARAHGEPITKKRGSGVVWTPRYAIRRAAWHALDHAWEIEDRSV